MRFSMQENVVSQRRDKKSSSLIKRTMSPWRKASLPGTYPTTTPILRAILLAVIMSTVGHCRCPIELPDDELVYLVTPPPTSNESTVGWVWQIEPDGR